VVDPAEYCRALENYLCQKNEGHLIRIVGPVFEQVCGWAERGVPLAIARKGIDQYCERYNAKGPRRRPVRIEFCEADILDLFDAWRRAVGVSASALTAEAEEAAPKRDTLPSHLDRAIARLTALRSGKRHSNAFDAVVDDAVRALDRERATAKRARGDERAALIERLAAVDRRLVEAAIAELDAARRADLEREADEELAPFAARMTDAARAEARRRAFERLARAAMDLPEIGFV
jgi:hypothetical protein